MRRAKPPGPLSPQLLKHFAAATVALTSLLALFASGADWGAQAQIQTVAAKNRLAATEAEKLGPKKLAAKLKISPEARTGTFGEDIGDFDNSYAGGDGTNYRSTHPIAVPGQGPAPMQLQRPGDGVSHSDTANSGLPGPRGKSRPAGPAQPTQQQLEQIKAASQHRSGGETSAD